MEVGSRERVMGEMLENGYGSGRASYGTPFGLASYIIKSTQANFPVQTSTTTKDDDDASAFISAGAVSDGMLSLFMS